MKQWTVTSSLMLFAIAVLAPLTLSTQSANASQDLAGLTAQLVATPVVATPVVNAQQSLTLSDLALLVPTAVGQDQLASGVTVPKDKDGDKDPKKAKSKKKKATPAKTKKSKKKKKS